MPDLPRRDAEDAAIRRFLGRAVIAAAAAAAFAAALGAEPDPIPAVALHHPAVWRTEAFAVILVVLYVTIASIALTFHGWLPTRLDTPAGGAALQPAIEQTAAMAEQIAAIEKLTDTVTESLDDIDRRLSALSKPDNGHETEARDRGK